MLLNTSVNNFEENFNMKDLLISNSCVNCENISVNSLCSFHNIQVNEKYTCEDFEESPVA